jgi:hypothetical protein
MGQATLAVLLSNWLTLADVNATLAVPWASKVGDRGSSEGLSSRRD